MFYQEHLKIYINKYPNRFNKRNGLLKKVYLKIGKKQVKRLFRIVLNLIGIIIKFIELLKIKMN